MAEVFVDEMAIAGGWDPLEWRLKMTEGMDDFQLVLQTLKDACDNFQYYGVGC